LFIYNDSGTLKAEKATASSASKTCDGIVLGSQSAGLNFGGYGSGGIDRNTEEYDGSSWSASNNLGTYGRATCGGGSQTAGLRVGGADNYDTPLNRTEEYNGTSWSNGGNLITKRSYAGACGTQIEALTFGGLAEDEATTLDSSESYDGSSWASVDSLLTARRYVGGNGSLAAGLAVAGQGGSSLKSTEEYA